MTGDIDRLTDDLFIEMCAQVNDEGLDISFSREEVGSLLPSAAVGHIDLALRDLVVGGKVTTSFSNSILLYYVDPDAYGKHLRESGLG